MILSVQHYFVNYIFNHIEINFVYIKTFIFKNRCNKMETLSYELIFELLLMLENQNLFNLCSANVSLSAFCQNDCFWKQKVLLDYPDAADRDNLTWKQFYILLSREHNKPIPVYYNNQLVGTVWISDNDTLDDILSTANRLFLSKFPEDIPYSLSLMDNSRELLNWSTPTINPRISTQNITNYYSQSQKLMYKNMSEIRRGMRGLRSSINRFRFDNVD